MLPYSARMLMKSKCEGGNVHGAVTSSISKRQLGGAKVGWMGERSIPVTSAAGCSSAMSMHQMPVPQPRSRTLWGGSGVRGGLVSHWMLLACYLGQGDRWVVELGGGKYDEAGLLSV